jgi:ribosomal protein S18 acetylase RimI-like enzyme
VHHLGHEHLSERIRHTGRVEERPERTVLERIEVLPHLQGRGMGTSYIETLKRRDLPIELTVMKANRRARALFLRLGFVDVGPRLCRGMFAGIRSPRSPSASGWPAP